jgi:hypothetical protein
MPRVRRCLVVHHLQDIRVHRIHAHRGCQLQQLPPEANDEHLVRRQAIQRPVRIDGVEGFLARASL